MERGERERELEGQERKKRDHVLNFMEGFGCLHWRNRKSASGEDRSGVRTTDLEVVKEAETAAEIAEALPAVIFVSPLWMS